jgi:hypothetical protein
MPLKGPRFAGDPVLEACFDGKHRMHAPEEGLAVKRVQAALIELGHSVGPAGEDGIFGSETGNAVIAYKTLMGLDPPDAVVGAGTAKALDDDLFFEPPELDPKFAEFSPFVVARRLEPFVALELAAHMLAPFGTWRRMLALFALAGLSSGRLLGIVAASRLEDLRAPYLGTAAAVQAGGLSAEDHFNQQTAPPRALGQTISFTAATGDLRSLILIRDDVILGRAVTIFAATGERAPESVRSVLSHELTHARNAAAAQALESTLDSDTAAYADTALAQAQTAAAGPTALVFSSFVDEICARHVEWNVAKEAEGNTGAIPALRPDQLAQAAILYFVREGFLFQDNGYIAGINAQGDASRLPQLDLWLRRCATFSFTDDPGEEARTQLLFVGAAFACGDQVAHPLVEIPEALGLWPLPQDFH